MNLPPSLKKYIGSFPRSNAEEMIIENEVKCFLQASFFECKKRLDPSNQVVKWLIPLLILGTSNPWGLYTMRWAYQEVKENRSYGKP